MSASKLRERLPVADARALLGLPRSYQPPPAADLVRDAHLIVDKNRALFAELSGPAEQGLLLSPVWEIGDGAARARLAVLPAGFRSRYFEGEGAEVLAEEAAIEIVCDVVPWMTDDPVGAAVALEDTLRTWLDDTAPTRSLDLPYQGHYRLLSLLLADIARKGSAGLSTLEWLGSIGLPIDDSRDDDDPPVEVIAQSMKEHLRAMWAEERVWLRAAFGR